MITSVAMLHFYQHSGFWDGVSVDSLFLLIFFELWALRFEELRSFQRRLERWGLLALFVLALADFAARHYRSIEEVAQGRLNSAQSDAIKGLTDQANQATQTIAALRGQSEGAGLIISALQGQINDAKRKSAELDTLTKQESIEIGRMQVPNMVADFALKAEGDDAEAFDWLQSHADVRFINNPGVAEAIAVVDNILRERNSHTWKLQLLQANLSESQELQMFNALEKTYPSQPPEFRRAAIDTLTRYPWQDVAHQAIFVQLIRIAYLDPSLDVREAAYRAYAAIMFNWFRTTESRVFNLTTPEQQEGQRMDGHQGA